MEMVKRQLISSVNFNINIMENERTAMLHQGFRNLVKGRFVEAKIFFTHYVKGL
jgi:hypothetical protein